MGRAVFRKGSKPIKTTASGQMKTSMEVRNKSTSGDGQFLVSFAFGDCVHIIYDIHIFIKIYSDIIIYINMRMTYIYMTYIILCIVYYIHLNTIYIYILYTSTYCRSIQEVGLGHEEILPPRWGFHGTGIARLKWRLENGKSQENPM